MNIVAIVGFGLAVFSIIGDLFYIGKPRPVYSGASYLIELLSSKLIIVLLAGRVFGWW